MESIVVALTTSLLVIFVYGALFAQREEQIREYFRTRSKGIIRRRYIKAFLEASQGQADVTDTRILGYIPPLIAIGIALVCITSALALEERAADIKSNITILEEMHKELESLLYGTKIEEEESVEETLKRLRAESNDIIELSNNLFKNINALTSTMYVLSIGAMLVYIYLDIWWRPFNVMRRRFSYELQRFTLRIQGLASKKELAEIAVAESQIVNERSLRHFVDLVRSVAVRHNVESLVETFDLWEEGTEVQ